MGLWKLKAQPSALFTAWRVLEDKIATKANLVRREISMVSVFVVCAGRKRKLRPISFAHAESSG